MTCTANGYPPPIFTITKEGVNVQTNVQPGIHIIDNVQLGDDGKKFSCTPTNQKGSGPAKEFKLVVIGKVTPYVWRQPLLEWLCNYCSLANHSRGFINFFSRWLHVISRQLYSCKLKQDLQIGKARESQLSYTLCQNCIWKPWKMGQTCYVHWGSKQCKHYRYTY